MVSNEKSQDPKNASFLSYSSHEEIISIVENARIVQKSWRQESISERISGLRKIYELMQEQKEILAQSVTQDMGMPIKFARDDVGYALNYFLWYLENAEKYLSPELVFESSSEIHTVFYEPK